jgi:NHLM bacteriocin system ABC transporter ATP-binding protein
MNVLSLLPARGERVTAGGDQPFLLRRPAVWLIEAGQVDVFTVRTDGDGPVGCRTHLVRIEAGGALFGADDALPHRGLLAVGTAGTVVVRVPADRLPAPGAVGEGQAVQDLLEGWIEALGGALSREAAPKRCEELSPCTARAVGADVAVRPQRSVSWIRHRQGRSLLQGRQELEVGGDGFTPLSQKAWLRTAEPVDLEVAATSAMAPGEIWQGLGRLHGFILRYCDLLATEGEHAERERTRRRAAAQSSILREACSLLVRTMDPRVDDAAAARVLPGDGEGETLLDACRIVGEALGIEFKAPPAAGGARPRDPLRAILTASRLRARKVALRDDWWRHDHGPLLGYAGEGQRPVALLPSAQGYRLSDAGAGGARLVSAVEAATLAPFAFTFYRPFPDAALAVKDIVQFGLQGCRGDIVLILVVGVASALLGLLPPMATGRLFDSVIPGAHRGQLVQLTLLLLACAFGAALFNLARSLALLRIEQRMGSAVQAAVWDRLLALPLSFFRPYTAGDLGTRAMAIDAIRQMVSGSTVSAAMGGILSLTSFALMFYYSTALAGWALALIVTALAVTAIGTLLQMEHQRTAIELQAKTSGLVLQLLSSIGKLKVAGAEVHAFGLWARRFAAQRRAQFQVRNLSRWVAAFNAAFPVIASMVLFAVGLPKLTGPEPLPTGHFLAFLAAFSSCSGGLLGTLTALMGLMKAVPLFEQARPILQTRTEVNVGKADPGALSGDIEMQHAVFRYQADGPVVLKDVSLRAEPGEFIALVGPSGSGKSTVLRLLFGFETLESGSIYYDGQDLDGLDIQAVRRQIGVVLQSGRLIAGDIFSNIAASGPISLEEAWEAARMAGVADDIRAMPMGMHTVVSQGGGTLSGGQRQRILIARAIATGPRLLFFDEATSALDNRTQAVVSASLERLRATRIVVAHRLSTIAKADRIYVLDQGRIVQVGTYSELMAQKGTFADIASRQIG